jgi:hypothetical protein
VVWTIKEMVLLRRNWRIIAMAALRRVFMHSLVVITGETVVEVHVAGVRYCTEFLP